MKKKKIINIVAMIAVVIAVACVGIIAIGNKNTQEKQEFIKEEVANQNDTNAQGEKYKLSTYVTEEMKQKATQGSSILCFANAFTPEWLKENCTNIAVVRVISQDYIDPDGFLTYTFGTMLINNSIYGNLEEGKAVKYIKAGGYIDMETWNNAQPEASRDKRIETRKEQGITTPLSDEYMNIVYSDDIELEVGKTYLAYLAYNEKYNAYEMIGYKWGLMEINIPQEEEYVSKIDIDFENSNILNNETNEYESIKEYIEKYINE